MDTRSHGGASLESFNQSPHTFDNLKNLTVKRPHSSVCAQDNNFSESATLVGQLDSKNVGNASRSALHTSSFGESGLCCPLALPQLCSSATTVAHDAPTSNYRLEDDSENACTLCVRGLPEWIDESELKSIFVRAKESLMELGLGLTNINQQCVTNIQIVRDPDTQKCIGYGYIEFIDHQTAALLLSSQTSPHLKIPNSNKPLTLSWAPSPVNTASVLENYQFYIANLRPDLTEYTVARLLRSIHPKVLSVRLIPQEVLGIAPIHYDAKSEPPIVDPTERAIISMASTSFYRAQPRREQSKDDPAKANHKPVNDESSPIASHQASEEPLQNSSSNIAFTSAKPLISSKKKRRVAEDEKRRWGCGFIRIQYKGNEWKEILRVLREKVNGEMGLYLRRDIGLTEKKDQPHPSSLIMIRPIFGKFEQTESRSQSITVKREYAGNIGVPSKTTVFVGGLGDETTEQDINAIFAPFGRVLSIRIVFLKHVGFIEMSDHRSALAALSHLKGTIVKKAKLHFDWGRTRPTHLMLPRHIEIESVVDHDSFLSEKTYAARRIQSMQPQKPTEEITQTPQNPAPSKNFWLASLCASLPTRPPPS